MEYPQLMTFITVTAFMVFALARLCVLMPMYKIHKLSRSVNKKELILLLSTIPIMIFGLVFLHKKQDSGIGQIVLFLLILGLTIYEYTKLIIKIRNKKQV